MEAPEKQEQSPDDALKGKIKLLNHQYHIDALQKLLGIDSKKVLYSAKKLPKGLQRKEVFSNATFVTPSSLAYQVGKLKHHPGQHTAEDAQRIHQKILAAGGANSHLECLLIRYARELFRKSYLR